MAEAALPLESVDTPRVTFIGALPPPVTGMTVLTAAVVDAIAQQTPLRKFNWSRGRVLSRWRWKLARAFGAFTSVLRLCLLGRAKGKFLYYSVSAGSGLYYDLVIAMTARLLGYRLVHHHHVYTYIDRHDWRVALLVRLNGSTGAHVVHCRLMQEDFLKQYPTRSDFWFIPPTILTPPRRSAERSSAKRSGDFTLGFMSNITFAKGIDEVIATFERLADEGRPIKLVLAGPCMGAREEAAVNEVLQRRPNQVEYRGAVYEKDKDDFFAAIDAFLLPTRSESWGIVLTEALAANRPVIARSRGCIPWIVKNGCGLAIDRNDDFVELAARQVVDWIDRPEAYEAAQRAAQQRTDDLSLDASRQLPEFVRWIAGVEDSDRDGGAACNVAAANHEQSSPRGRPMAID